jgi:membrane-bound serine protease (ClpP class)
MAEEIVRKSRSFSAKEAYEVNLVDAVTESVELFLGAVDGKKVKLEASQTEVRLRTKGAFLKSIEMTPGQKLLHFLADPNVATTLMSLGGLLIYVEVANPGITIAGILGGICLITGFMSFQLLPVRTGGLVLLLLGFLMFILEAFVTSHGALAAGGLLSLILGILWVMDPAGGTLRIDPQVWVPVVFTLGAAVAAMSWAMARTQSLVKKTLAMMRGGGKSGLQGYPGVVEWVDAQDASRGRVVIRGEIWSAMALDGALKLGETVEVVRVDGLTIQVRASARPENQ